ncbi:glycolate oxidase subunit GlcF [Acidocella sp.]|uniref:glycolate oxidase subunit GlcF n=1 Tax=Acidocella sp. TaxID=50710 RepID=UPI00262245E1|nr:glycolate oxidase subunit GlcF [Acidocella sp.]
MQTNFPPALLADADMASSAGVIRKCVHCGFCTATCPTYVLGGNELDSPRGRIYLIKDMLENERAPSADVVKHIDRCLSCLSCMTTCPSGVNYMHLVDHARAYIEARHRRPPMERALRTLVAAILPYPARLRAALRAARLARPLAPLLKGRLRPAAAMLKLAPAGPLPAPARAEPRRGDAPAPRGRVVLLQGCAEPVLRPEIRAATARLLERCGYRVEFAKGEECCGALTAHMGKAGAARQAARRNVDAWMREIEAGLEAIVITASGCGTHVKDYGFLLRDDPAYADRAARVAALARDISEVLEAAGLPPRADIPPLRVAYHPPCSIQHGQKLVSGPQNLLRAAGFEVRMPAEAHLCCGSAGTYNIFQPQIAGELGTRKAAALARLNADIIATGNIGCAVQIEHHAGAPVLHIVELLDWATGGPVPLPLADRLSGTR